MPYLAMILLVIAVLTAMVGAGPPAGDGSGGEKNAGLLIAALVLAISVAVLWALSRLRRPDAAGGPEQAHRRDHDDA